MQQEYHEKKKQKKNKNNMTFSFKAKVDNYLTKKRRNRKNYCMTFALQTRAFGVRPANSCFRDNG